MPIYQFVCPTDEDQTCDLYYPIDNAPKIGSIVKDEDGKEWKRVFSLPEKTFDQTQINPNSALAFEKNNQDKRYTFGDVWKKSAEMSEKRAQERGGVDPIRTAWYDKYAKERKGVRHPLELIEKNRKRFR